MPIQNQTEMSSFRIVLTDVLFLPFITRHEKVLFWMVCFRIPTDLNNTIVLYSDSLCFVFPPNFGELLEWVLLFENKC